MIDQHARKPSSYLHRKACVKMREIMLRFNGRLESWSVGLLKRFVGIVHPYFRATEEHEEMENAHSTTSLHHVTYASFDEKTRFPR